MLKEGIRAASTPEQITYTLYFYTLESSTLTSRSFASQLGWSEAFQKETTAFWKENDKKARAQTKTLESKNSE